MTTEPTDDDEQYQACCALWRAVILQAFLDMASKTKNRKLVRKRDIAAFWLSEGSRSLRMVCDYADLDMDVVIKHARLVGVGQGLNWKKQAGTSPNYEIYKMRRLKRKQLKLLRRGMPQIRASVYDSSKSEII